MKRKGSAYKQPKWIKKRPKKAITFRYGFFKKKDRICALCKTKRRLTIHHIRPRAKGGTDERSNLMVLCIKCHMEWHHPYMFSQTKRKMAEYLKSKV